MAVWLLVVAIAGAVVVVIMERSVRPCGQERLLIINLAAASVVVALAAAGAEEPEQRCSHSESSPKPDSGQETCVNAAAYTVVLGSSLDGTNNDDCHGGDHCCGGAYSNRGDTTNQVGDTRDGTAAVGESTSKQLDTESDHGDDINNLCPLGDLLERAERASDLGGQGNIVSRAGDVARVQCGLCPVELSLGASSITIGVGSAVSLYERSDHGQSQLESA